MNVPVAAQGDREPGRPRPILAWRRIIGAALGGIIATIMLHHMKNISTARLVDHGAGSSGWASHGLQEWIETNYGVAAPVDEMARMAGLTPRNLERRFRRATGHSPIDYVQRLRVEEAKRRLEHTDAPVDEISWEIGYENTAFFRRLFRRLTRLSPGEYRRKFRMPNFVPR